MKQIKYIVILSLLFLLCASTIYSQGITYGFNYQAVARDKSGNPVINKNLVVEVSIKSGGTSGTVVWQESQNVLSNEFGIFTLVVGEGITTGVGTLTSFNDIDWENNNYYIQIRVDFGNGLSNMGTYRLNYVPYAKIADSVRSIGSKYAAGDVTGPFNNLKVTAIQGKKVTSASPLNGQILKWNSATSTWELSSASGNTFIAGNGISLLGDTIINSAPNTIHSGDVIGSTALTVVAIQGNSVSTSAPSLNQFLSWNGSEWTPTTGSTGGVGGSGSSNLITFWTGASTISNDTNLYWDNVNKRLGIGLTTPGQQLDINGNMNISNSISNKGIIYKGVNTFIHNYGTGNTFLGINSGNLTLTGNNNTADGYQTLNFCATCFANTATGYQALYSNVSGIGNVANGYQALYFNNSHDNIATGVWALYNNTTGLYNTATGTQALYSNTTGIYNTSEGSRSLYSNTTGFYNTAVGDSSLYSNTTGNYNTALGYFADVSSGILSNATVIGYGATVNTSNKVRIGNFAVTTIEGQVGFSAASDKRFKQNIKDIGVGLDFIMKLRPVEYQTKTGDTRLNYGFIAQELLQIVGEGNTLVNIGNDPDKTLSVRHSDLIAPVVKAIQEQQTIIQNQQKQIDFLLKENQQTKTENQQIKKLLINKGILVE